MNLNDYLNKLIERGFLRAEQIGVDQIKALLKNAKKNIFAAQKNLEIDEETCYTMAYNAMLKTARTLVFLQGFRPIDGQQHKITIEIAGKILGKNFGNLIDQLDKMRKKRNQFTYDPLIPLSRQEANNALKNTVDFYKKVKNFLEQNSPQLKLFKDK